MLTNNTFLKKIKTTNWSKQTISSHINFITKKYNFKKYIFKIKQLSIILFFNNIYIILIYIKNIFKTCVCLNLKKKYYKLF